MHSRIIPILVLLLGLVLGAMAVPRLIASLRKLPLDSSVAWLWHGGVLSPVAYGTVVEKWRLAARWIDDPATWADLGLAYLAAARSAAAADSTNPQHLLAEARQATRRSLALAPAQPYAWVNYAYLATVDGNMEGAATALAWSFRFGPFIPGMALSRAQLGLINWGALDADVREQIAGEVRRALREAAPQLVAFARGRGFVDQIRLLLAEDLELLVRFDVVLGASEP